VNISYPASRCQKRVLMPLRLVGLAEERGVHDAQPPAGEPRKRRNGQWRSVDGRASGFPTRRPRASGSPPCNASTRASSQSSHLGGPAIGRCFASAEIYWLPRVIGSLTRTDPHGFTLSVPDLHASAKRHLREGRRRVGTAVRLTGEPTDRSGAEGCSPRPASADLAPASADFRQLRTYVIYALMSDNPQTFVRR
jgi:hypothetical protein